MASTSSTLYIALVAKHFSRPVAVHTSLVNGLLRPMISRIFFSMTGNRPA
jgi:hypothetical protein